MIVRRTRAEIVRYLVVGAVNTFVTYLLLLLAMRWMHYALAYTLVYCVGVALAYALQTRYVFRVRARWRTAVRFPLVYVAQYLLGLALLAVLVEAMAMPHRWAALVTIAATVPAGYLLSRRVLASKQADASCGCVTSEGAGRHA